MFFRKSKRAWQAGDRPPVGAYFCLICLSQDSCAVIRRAGQALPRCPVCGGDRWVRV